MDLTNLTPNILTELLQLVEQKQALEKQISGVDAQITALVSGQKQPEAPAPKKEKAPAKKRVKRGEGTQVVLDALNAAGPDGISILELKEKVAVSGAYLNALLGSLVKKGIATRVGRGTYATKEVALGVPTEGLPLTTQVS